MTTLTGIADHVQPGITDHFHRNAKLSLLSTWHKFGQYGVPLAAPSEALEPARGPSLARFEGVSDPTSEGRGPQPPILGSAITRSTAGDDIPAEANATAASDIAELPGRSPRRTSAFIGANRKAQHENEP